MDKNDEDNCIDVWMNKKFGSFTSFTFSQLQFYILTVPI